MHHSIVMGLSKQALYGIISTRLVGTRYMKNEHESYACVLHTVISSLPLRSTYNVISSPIPMHGCMGTGNKIILTSCQESEYKNSQCKLSQPQ